MHFINVSADKMVQLRGCQFTVEHVKHQELSFLPHAEKIHITAITNTRENAL
jgi:hypothetical protein